MTTFTNIEGKSTVICDHCRCDLDQGSTAFILSTGKIAEGGYCSRDYSKSEMVICPDCAKVIGQIMTIMGNKRADNLIILQEAA